MVSLIEETGNLIGFGGGGGGGTPISLILVIFLVFLVISAVLGISTYYLVNWLQYRYKIRIFEKIGGKFIETRTDRAKFIKWGDGGDIVLYLRKNKKTLQPPSSLAGVKTYYYAISEDGEWLDFVPGDLDARRKEMGAIFLDKEVRFARTSLQNTRRERYEAPTWWQKYGGLVAYAIFILLTGISLWLLVGKMIELSQTISSAMETAKLVLENTGKILASNDAMIGGINRL